MKNRLKFHPLVENIRKNAKKIPLDKGFLICRRQGLDIRVTPENLDRALMIMDSLIKALEVKCAQVSTVKNEYNNITHVTISDEVFEIDIIEKMNIVKKEPDQFGSKVDYIPNGNLVLRIKNAYGVRTEWKVDENQEIEVPINSYIEGLYKAVAKAKELHKEHEKWDEGRKQREEVERLQVLENQRIVNLEKEAILWQRSTLIRAYIAAATKVYIEGNGQIEPGSEFDKWRTWATQRADSLNPLISNPPENPVK